jgi:predicted peroxiredoxin
MSSNARSLVVVNTHGPEEELSTVAFTVACGGMTKGMKVSMFLTGPGVDVVRKRAADSVHVKPFDPLTALVQDFIERGGAVWACTPCCKSRGYEEKDLIAGVTVVGAGPMHDQILEGAATLSF